MKKCDVVIIGGGLGGLIAGSLLSKKGKKVILIEQHKVVGGCASSFKRLNCTIEVSLHALDGLDSKDVKIDIFNELDIFKNVKFIKLPELYTVYRDSNFFLFPCSKQNAIKELIKRFPDEEFGIIEYFSTLAKVRNEIYSISMYGINKYYSEKVQQEDVFLLKKYSRLTIGEYLDSIIKDEWLKLILLANISYYHDDPYSLSFIYYCIAQESYYNGCWYIGGSSQTLSDYLAKIITDNGGEIIKNNLVTDILMKDCVAIGVQCKSLKKKSEKQVIKAKFVVANTSFNNVKNMLPLPFQQLFMKNVLSFKNSCSCTSVHLIFKNKLPINIIDKHYNIIIYPKQVNALKDLSWSKDIKNKIINFVYYSLVDSSLSYIEKGIATISIVDYISNWNNLPLTEYRNKKKNIAQYLINCVNEVVPIKDFIESYEVSTPRTIERFTLNPSGAIYGYAQTPEQSLSFRPNNSTVISGLYMASAWTSPGGGFSGAIVSGYMCFKEILKK